MYNRFKQFFGIETSTTSTSDKLVASIGGVLGISLTFYISLLSTDLQGAAIIVPSMGASAVLLFAVPHGALSQPWALFCGHLVSAFVGVSCYLLIPNPVIAAGLAVGLAIGLMHLFNCIHPPGGATALAAVIGGEAIHQLGFWYLLTPIGLNVLIIFIVAVIFNSGFHWRRYPGYLMRFIENNETEAIESASASPLQHKHIEQALKDMDLLIDATPADLNRLFLLALQHAENDRLSASQIKLGHYYTNGKHGRAWSVRQVIDEAPHADPDKDLIIYRCSEGAHYGKSNSCTREEFAQWAAREVLKNSDR